HCPRGLPSRPRPWGSDIDAAGTHIEATAAPETTGVPTALDIPAPRQALAVRPSLAGLGREGLRAALAAIGVPDRQLKMRAGQLWSWMLGRGGTAVSDTCPPLT